MEFKLFLKSSNIEEEMKSASIEAKNNTLIIKASLLDNNTIECVKCKSSQNVNLANVALLSENRDEYPFYLCENCRKASSKVKIFR